MKRIVIVLVLSLILVTLIAALGCGGEKGSTTPTPTPTPTPTATATPTPVLIHGSTPVSTLPMAPTPATQRYIPVLEIDVTLDQSFYLPGEAVKIRLYFKNVSNGMLELSRFPPTVSIYRFRQSDDMIIWQLPSGGEERVLSPGESLTHEVIWDQRQLDGNLVDPGHHYDIQVEARYKGTTRSGIRSASARVLIQHPQGAIERVLDIEETRTVGGVVITLNRVELSSTGAKVYALAQPPDWSPPATAPSTAVPTPIPTPGSRPYHYYPVPAQISLNGGPMRDAGTAGLKWLEEGIGLTWDLVDPLPDGTEHLTFVITQLGIWPGPWEFSIPLQ